MGNATLAPKAPATVKESESIKNEVEPSLIDWKTIWKPLGIIVGVFIIFFWLPVGNSRFNGAVIESLALAKWYAQEHVILCLVPAFFIAGAIACFVSQAAVMKYLGAGAKKVPAYGVASVSGSILAVCSCTVLPLFASIWKRGAGLGPALALLLAGPALSLPNMLVIRSVMGTKKTVTYVTLVVIMATISGMIFGHFYR
jgi:uncharacterized membrane protein YraQ (UPF0718 family)